MFKYELGQIIFYLMDNKVHSAKVLSRCLVENLHEDWDATEAQRRLYKPFDESGIFYSTCHGVVKESDAFVSKDDLKKAI